MRHTARNHFRWSDNDLLFKRKIFMRIFPDKDHINMWRVEYPDNVLSADFYNKTRAKENALTEAMRIKGMEWKLDSEESADV